MIIRLSMLHLRLAGPTSVSAVARPQVDGTDLQSLPRDSRNGVMLPGTSVAGALRSILGDQGSALMGDVSKTRDADGVERTVATASQVRLTGCRVQPSGDLEVRASTAVDTATGAGRAHSLRRHELLPTGSTVTVYLRLDSTEPEADAEAWSYLKNRFKGWSPILGAGATRGWGSAVVDGWSTGTLDLSDDSDLLTWLTVGGPELFEQVAKAEPTPQPSVAPDLTKAWLSAAFVIHSALHVGSVSWSADPRGAVLEPVRQHDDTSDFYIPGSTWKGVFRARAVEILGRLGAGCRRADDVSPRVCDVDDPCLLCDMFGVTYPGPVRTRDDGPRVVGRQGSLTFLDSPIHGSECEVRTHVAIDRFTGSGHDRRLYRQRVVTEGTVSLIVVARREPKSGGRALLEAVVRDIDDDLVGIGGGTTRGHGSLRLVRSPGLMVRAWSTIAAELSEAAGGSN